MIISKNKFQQSIADVAVKYEEKITEMKEEMYTIQNEHKRNETEYEMMLRKYDEIHGVNYKGEYINGNGQINMCTYFQRKKELYDQGISDGESPFLS